MAQTVKARTTRFEKAAARIAPLPKHLIAWSKPGDLYADDVREAYSALRAAAEMYEALRALNALVMERTLAAPLTKDGVIDPVRLGNADRILAEVRAAIRLAEGETK